MADDPHVCAIKTTTSETALFMLVIAIILRFFAASVTFAYVVDKCNHRDEVIKIRRLAILIGGTNFLVMSLYISYSFTDQFLRQSKDFSYFMLTFVLIKLLFLGMTAKLAYVIFKCHCIQTAKKSLMSLLAVQEWALLFGSLGFVIEDYLRDLELTLVLATVTLGLSAVWYMAVAGVFRSAERFRNCLDKLLPWKLGYQEQIVRSLTEGILEMISQEPFPLGDFYLEGSWLGNGTYGHVRQYNLNKEVIRKHCLSKGCRRNGLIDAVTERIQSSDYNKVAVKEFTSENGDSMIRREVLNLRQLTHENIVKLFGALAASQDGNRTTHLVMELCQGSLKDLCHPSWGLDEMESGHLLLQILCGVEFMHAKNILHRDLTPRNILVKQRFGQSLNSRRNTDITDIIVKISDFGFSRKVGAAEDQQSLTMRVGTPAYLAPEVSETAYYHKPADIYSVGVIAFELLNKTLPTNEERNALHSGHWMPKRKNLEQLMAQMMRYEPEFRPTAAQSRGFLSSASDFIKLNNVYVMGINITDAQDIFTITMC